MRKVHLQHTKIARALLDRHTALLVNDAPGLAHDIAEELQKAFDLGRMAPASLGPCEES